MRFKPRTDIERIFDEINKNSFRKLDKKILDNQMREIISRKSLHSNKSNESFSKNKDENKSFEKNNFEKELSFFNDNNDDIEQYLNNLRRKKEEERRKQSNDKEYRKLYNRKNELNQEAKKILNEFHHKTHFKAVSMIANHYKERGIFFL